MLFRIYSDPIGTIISLIITMPALIISLTGHEFMHGYVAYKLGDPTPKNSGRLSLNPLRHLDILGSISLLLAGFGWAKPVPVNPYYLKKPKRDMSLIALAGPFANFFMAYISILLYGILYAIGSIPWIIMLMVEYLAIININLGIFNLIPVPPLDGSKVLFSILPDREYFKYMQFERYGMFILIILLFTDILTKPLNFLTNLVYSIMQTVASGLLNIIGL